jgi:hypothetical protein
MFTYMRSVTVLEICNMYQIQRAVSQNVSGPTFIHIFHLFMVIQHILKFMKNNIKSPCMGPILQLKKVVD